MPTVRVFDAEADEEVFDYTVAQVEEIPSRRERVSRPDSQNGDRWLVLNVKHVPDLNEYHLQCRDITQ